MATETIDTEIVCPIVTAEAKIIPITAARIAFMAAFTRVDWFSVLTKRDNNTVKTIGGVNMAMVANNAPMIPATLYPMKVAVMNIGPGVICPIAIPSANSAEVSQPKFSTNNSCKAGMTTYPPPNRVKLIPEKVDMIWIFFGAPGYCPPKSKSKSNNNRTTPEMIHCLFPNNSFSLLDNRSFPCC